MKERERKGELSISQKQAVIKLLEKKGRDKRLIKNWRQISLLNVDVKLLTKSLATKMKKVLQNVISLDQTAYVVNGFIGESARLISDILDITKKNWLSVCSITMIMHGSLYQNTYLKCITVQRKSFFQIQISTILPVFYQNLISNWCKLSLNEPLSAECVYIHKGFGIITL